MVRMHGDARRCPDSKYSTPMPRGKLSLTTAVVRAIPSSFVAFLSLFLLMATPPFTPEQITWLQAALPLGAPRSSWVSGGPDQSATLLAAGHSWPVVPSVPGPSAAPSVAPPLLAQQSDATFSECTGITKLNDGSNYGKFGGNSSQ